MNLCGKLVCLVPFTVEHLQAPEYLAWLRDYEVVKTINRPEYLETIPFEEVKRYVEALWESDTDIFLAVTHRTCKRFVGTVRAARIDLKTLTADLGILIGDRNYWGSGVATDALSVLADYLFHELGLRRLTAGLLEPNKAMLRVFEKLGFVKEGVFRKHDLYEGEYVDHIFLGCFKNEFVPLHK